MSTSARRLAWLLGILPCLFLAAERAAADPDWPQLAGRLQQVQREARAARIALDPAAILETETALAAVLDSLARHLCPAPETDWPAPRLAGRLIEALLAARLPGVWTWLGGLSAAERERLDPSGGLDFWLALERNRRRQAGVAALLDGPVPPALHGHADWLKVRALDREDSLEAGALAVALVQRESSHLFAASLTLRGVHHLLVTGEVQAARRLLERRGEHLRESVGIEAAAETYAAEFARREGRQAAFAAAFEHAADLAPGAPRGARLRRQQAEWVLGSSNTWSSSQLRAALEVVSALAPAARAFHAWRAVREELAPSDLRRATRSVLAALYGARRAAEFEAAVAWVETGGDRETRLYAKLLAGRMARRTGDLVAMEAAWRQAAMTATPAGELSAREAAEAARALWELGRELEDAGEWSAAAATYGELAQRFTQSRHARESRLREALCRFRAGEREAAGEQLERLCAGAAADQTAGPCLWRAFLAGGDSGGAAETTAAAPAVEIRTWLERAAAERNPGYFAHRARRALPRLAAGAVDDSSTWADWAREAGDSAAWRWPAVAPCIDPPTAERLLDLIEAQPIARRGILFLQAGETGWARAQWRRLPGWRALNAAERAALLRALGDQGEGIRTGIRVGDRRARYPVAYAPEIAAAAARCHLSPLLLLAVLRQESLLEVGARSAAGAIGLMQLMPATARRMADTLGWREFDLLRPAENIMLGSRHLEELLTAAGGELPVALAAYNGGLEPARRWRRRAANLDEFVELIGYGETRRFVKSVLMHYGFLQALYAGEAGAPAAMPAD